MSHLPRSSGPVTAVVMAIGVGLAGCSSGTAATDAASSVAGAASSAANAAASDASTAASKASTAAAGAASKASTAAGSASAAVKSYPMAEVKSHNTTSSCWAVVKNNVYDLTTWIAKHPGGPDRIKQLCGTDGTAKFKAEHNLEAKPNQKLASFKIGKLSG